MLRTLFFGISIEKKILILLIFVVYSSVVFLRKSHFEGKKPPEHSGLGISKGKVRE